MRSLSGGCTFGLHEPLEWKGKVYWNQVREILSWKKDLNFVLPGDIVDNIAFSLFFILLF